MAKIQEVTPEIPLREAILTTVNSHQGIKGVELVLNVMGMVGPVMFDDREYMLELSRLLDEGEIIEIEYALPTMEYRLKSLYFPKGTRINAPEAHTINDGGATVLHRI
jgi:hypothetical protein